MVSYPTPVAIVLTVIFAAAAVGFGLLLTTRGISWQARTISAVHFVMSVAMLAMPWSWGRFVAPPTAQVAVFSLAAAFFLVLLSAPELRVAAAGPHGAHAAHIGPLLVTYHAVMVSAMVVMAGGMLGPAGTARGPMAAMGSMPGMTMSAGATSSAAAVSLRSAAGGGFVYWAFAAIFAAGAVWLALRSRRPGRPRVQRASDLLLLTMSGGMALAFVPF